ncbi:hypothetical protein HPB49_020486 [Dermacentor silvarum]|uniref:Uncharacterized protein n=1 Tax=Dermacentor silvarum TaxID=543639 RepID=A0ACB8CSP2_DERSI|nr:hypothetical protein HPB49_020486 [Dermacentor silvarum]
MLRLPANQDDRPLVQVLNNVDAASAVQEVDLTNCILVDPDELHRHIGRCKGLRSLRCVACKLRPSDLLRLMLERLPSLVQVQFSLVAQTGVGSEISQPCAKCTSKSAATRTSRSSPNLLRFCPNLNELRVHVVSGTFWNALLECRAILEERVHLETFTFSSEVPASIQRLPVRPLEFASCAVVCANVTHRRSFNSWSCVRLRDLATAGSGVHVLPAATGRGDRSRRRRGPHRGLDSFGRPQARGATHGDSLRELFSAALLENIVELNEGALSFLRALSAPPCGLCHPFALDRLARNCRHLEDLDVRIYRRGSFVRCSVCECEFHLLEARKRLSRLTLSDVPKLASLQFLESSQVGTLRLSDCPDPWHPDFARLGQLLANNSALRSLVLRHDALPFGETAFLANLCHMTGLQYLCLVTALRVSGNVAATFVRELAAKMPRLKCLHVHYRATADGAEQRVTWMRREGAVSSSDGVVRDAPCFLCSTATFIGLAKPVNHDYHMTL